MKRIAIGLVLTGAAAAVILACSDRASSSITESTSSIELVDATPQRVCPSSPTQTEGMDISDWQYVKWDEVAANNPNRKFALARISAGLVRTDSRFHWDWPEMKRAGLLRGAYQYFKPSQSAIAQAELLARRFEEEGGLKDDDLPPMLDFETTNDMPAETVVCRVKLWLARVERTMHRKPLFYTSIQHNAYLQRELQQYPLWVAFYVNTPSSTCPKIPNAWDKWSFWQHSQTTRIQGVYSNGARNNGDGGAIELQTYDGGDGGPTLPGSDANFFDGTVEDLKRFVETTHSSALPEDPPLPNPAPVVPGATMTPGDPVECSDGCCTPG